MAETKFDRAAEDVGNIALFEHVNVTVPDQHVATLFYVTGLGFTRDPYLDFGTLNTWVNVGEQQFHLPTGKAQKIRGHIGVVVPSLEGLQQRLKFAARELGGTAYTCTAHDDHFDLTCPYGNRIKAYPAASVPAMKLGILYVEFHVPDGAAGAIGSFYQQVMRCPVHHEESQAIVKVGYNQTLRFVETAEAIPDYDGHHIAIYVNDFSGPHAWLNARGLITEESNQYQYRFQDITDPASGESIYTLEHEVRSLSHPMYRRTLINRNAEMNFRTYQKGADAYHPNY